MTDFLTLGLEWVEWQDPMLAWERPIEVIQTILLARILIPPGHICLGDGDIAYVRRELCPNGTVEMEMERSDNMLGRRPDDMSNRILMGFRRGPRLYLRDGLVLPRDPITV